MKYKYYANGFSYKLVQKDNAWCVYRWHKYRGDYEYVARAETLEKAKTWCYLCEPVPVPLKRLC